MSDKLNYFRPKARHIFTIWKDLIKDDFSALIELIKNAYDADAKKVDICFEKLNDNKIKIIIKDDWHGMTEDIIRNKWLVPSTDNKKNDKISPWWRIFQWQKWIWRYATSVLWDELILQTIQDWVNTTISIDWNNFNVDKFLDEIQLNITSSKTIEENGTHIEVIWNEEKLDLWLDENRQKKLKIELEKLKPPFFNEKFEISIKFFSDDITTIWNEELQEYFDYKVAWEIDENGNAVFIYKNNDTWKEEKIEKKLKIESKDSDIKWNFKYPWKIKFNFLALDLDDLKKREKVSLSFNRNINREEQVNYYKKYAWVSIYRWGFRIRPYWEKNEDWLHLNSRRVNNPTLRLSTNQLLWYVTIDSEDKSWLIEASSREKLKENEYFYWLIFELRQIINELEERKWKYRWEVWLRDKIEKELNIEEKIEKLQTEIKKIENEDDKIKVIEETKKLWDDFKKEKERLEKIITQYEGQVTLWKLLSITFHEVAKPTKFMRENITNIKYYIEKIEKNLIWWLWEFWDNLLEILKWYELNAKVVSDFMSKNLQPLVKWKWKPTYFNLYNLLKHSINTFNSEFEKYNIKVITDVNEKIQIYWYERDFLVAFTNFIDNSIYWLNEGNKENKVINISYEINDDLLELYFKDNGFWLLNIKDNDDILEPWFTRKEWWTWLWLSIAWEVLNKNNTDLIIIWNDEEYNFILKLIVKEWQK